MLLLTKNTTLATNILEELFMCFQMLQSHGPAIQASNSLHIKKVLRDFRTDMTSRTLTCDVNHIKYCMTHIIQANTL